MDEDYAGTINMGSCFVLHPCRVGQSISKLDAVQQRIKAKPVTEVGSGVCLLLLALLDVES